MIVRRKDQPRIILKNWKVGDQHIRSATGCCWTSQISSRQVYQLVLFRWKLRHREGFQNIRKNIVAKLHVSHLFEEKNPNALSWKTVCFFSRAKLVLSPNLMFIWVHFFILLIKMMSTSPPFFWNSSYVGILTLNINNENFNRAFWCSLHLCAKEKQPGASGEGHIF